MDEVDRAMLLSFLKVHVLHHAGGGPFTGNGLSPSCAAMAMKSALALWTRCSCGQWDMGGSTSPRKGVGGLREWITAWRKREKRSLN